MNSLLIPLSGESDCSGRSSRGLSPAEAAWLLSHQQPPEPCPWQKLSQPVPRPPSPPASPQSHALPPPELASIPFNGRDLNPVFLELAAICLSPRPCLGWRLCISISQLGCGMLLFVPWMGSLSVCLSSWHSYPQLEPADPSSLPSCVKDKVSIGVWIWNVLPQLALSGVHESQHPGQKMSQKGDFVLLF